MQYKITEIDVHNIREWGEGERKTFYIPVMVDGHDKWVSIGKKDKDALKAGDIVNGTIQTTTYDTDKFKADGFPQKSGFSPAERAKSADGQRQGMAMNNANQYLIAKGDTKLTPDEWADSVFEYAQALYAKGDLGK